MGGLRCAHSALDPIDRGSLIGVVAPLTRLCRARQDCHFPLHNFGRLTLNHLSFSMLSARTVALRRENEPCQRI